MRNNRVRTLHSSALVIHLVLATAAIAAPGDKVTVVGWPLPDLSGDAPPSYVGDDPVYGRQICPPLTRLNLVEKRSEELLLKHVTAELKPEGTKWRYELRPGLYWWDGSPATSHDLVEFLRREIPDTAKVRSGGLWQVPEFKVTADGDQAVEILFSRDPGFGPFVLNGVPFYRAVVARKEAGFRFECVGLYRPEAKPSGLSLVPTSGYKFRRELPEIQLVKDGRGLKSLSSAWLSISYAGAITSTPASRPPDVASNCSRTLELPSMLMLVWNQSSPFGADPAFRRAIGQLVPRSALVSAGAAGLGEVASTPVPRQHPGYKADLSPRPFDLHAASVVLNNLGYRRASSGAPRLDAQGRPLHLLFLTQRESQGLAEKVMIDTLSAVGISVDVRTDLPEGGKADATFTEVSLDWPRVSLLAQLHSGSLESGPMAPLGDAALDRELAAYAFSITKNTPDFSILGSIQRRLYELEPVTVLMQQKACIDSSPNFRLARGSISQRDPDWFRQLLF